MFAVPLHRARYAPALGPDPRSDPVWVKFTCWKFPLASSNPRMNKEVVHVVAEVENVQQLLVISGVAGRIKHDHPTLEAFQSACWCQVERGTGRVAAGLVDIHPVSREPADRTARHCGVVAQRTREVDQPAVRHSRTELEHIAAGGRPLHGALAIEDFAVRVVRSHDHRVLVRVPRKGENRIPREPRPAGLLEDQ